MCVLNIFLNKLIDTLKTLARIASCDVIFDTRDWFYRQVNGLAISSPPAPHLASCWMSTFDKTIQGNSNMYIRYMDDVLCSIHRDYIDDHL